MSRILLVATYLLAIAAPMLAGAAERPQWFVRIPDSVDTLLVADTSNATLYAYRFAEGDAVEVTEHYLSIGENGVGKTRTGDRRTPLGVYFVTDRLDPKRLHEKYGDEAFPLDYPNVVDRQNERSGYGIWLHGVERGTGQRPERDTDGCLALPNEDLTALAPLLSLNKTPVVITRSVGKEDSEALDNVAQEIEAGIQAWQSAHEEQNLLAYESLYGPEFVYRGLERPEWLAFRARQFTEQGTDVFSVSDLLILADPEDPALYVTRFRTSRESAESERVKRLYWKRGPDGRFRIVAEDNG